MSALEVSDQAHRLGKAYDVGMVLVMLLDVVGRLCRRQCQDLDDVLAVVRIGR